MSQALGLGEKLRALRQAQGLSQRALAQLAGLTHGNLSHIEQGKISPSVLTLEKILNALNIPIASFFAMAEPRAILPGADWPGAQEAGVHWSFMEVLAAASPTYLVVHRLQPGAVQSRDFLRHRGVLAGCVVSGRLELSLDDTQHNLAPGDGFYFSHQRSFRLTNKDSTLATWLGVSLLPAQLQPPVSAE
ncbi:MAG TPA: helix-turn-helix domain-containing protein [Cellvibrionaceae bacterium]|nr:helix-turn-helix domain-containing protein [Cellvibrionaceae bacterium]HMW73652.1 helix-turn-helix domain-containing protein [Cellvibrionaceae bacterium]HMY41134.1 helix-turn-helix domain-containing protein [Marinagarivorans sp.]HNG58416.1 helix-turn-helix domain-containing protein [Cellvibrionaceae bacterium]